MRFFVNFVNINGEPLTSDIGKPGIDFIDSFRDAIINAWKNAGYPLKWYK